MGKCYLLHLGYDGTHYNGWQKQPDRPSIQETMYKTLEELFPKGRIRVFAASRTDSGVHSLGQTCKLDIPCKLPAQELKDLINNSLPNDIITFDARRIAPSFKITDYVCAKEYLYFFSGPKLKDYPFVAKFEELFDIDLMKEAIHKFLGEHSFHHYQYRSQAKGGFKRTILDIDIFQAKEIFSKVPEEVYCLRIKGTGFLKQMIRLIMGALINIGSGKISLDQLSNSLTENGEPVGFIAPAKGLILHKIDYPDWQDEKIPNVDDNQFWKNEDLAWGFFPNKTLK